MDDANSADDECHLTLENVHIVVSERTAPNPHTRSDIDSSDVVDWAVGQSCVAKADGTR